MIKNILVVLFFIIGMRAYTQKGSVGIGTSNPDSSAILDLVANNKGLMIPQFSLNPSNVSDFSFLVARPKESLLIFNTNESFPGGKGIYYWDGTKWIFFFTPSNINLLLGITKYYSKVYSRGVSVASNINTDAGTVNAFVNNTTIGSPWIEIADGPALNFVIDRPMNNSVITFTGMLHVNNSIANGNIAYGLGIFVDDKLVTSKSASLNIDSRCAFQEFTITGLADNLSVGSHSVRLAVMNRGSSASGVSVSYGQKAPSCANVSDDETRVSAIVLVNQPLPY